MQDRSIAMYRKVKNVKKEKKGIESFDNKQCLSDVLNYISERIGS